MAPGTVLKTEGPQKHVVGDRNLYLPLRALARVLDFFLRNGIYYEKHDSLYCRCLHVLSRTGW